MLHFMLKQNLVPLSEFYLQTTLGTSDDSCLRHELQTEGFSLLDSVQLAAEIGQRIYTELLVLHLFDEIDDSLTLV